MVCDEKQKYSYQKDCCGFADHPRKIDESKNYLKTLSLLTNTTKVISFSHVGRGHLICMPGKPSIRVTRPWLTYTSSLGDITQDLNSHWRGKFYCLAPEAPFFRRISTESKAFLGIQGVSGLRLYTRTHLKKPCATLACLVRRLTNTTKVIYISRRTKLCTVFSPE